MVEPGEGEPSIGRGLAGSRAYVVDRSLGLLPDGPSFRLTSAVLFKTEVATGDDAPGLCGKVSSRTRG